MSEYILNMLPVNEGEKADFEALMPHAQWVYTGRSTVTREQLEQATIILGWPRVADLAHASNLHWLQGLFAGVDEYLAPGILGEHVTISRCAGAYSQAVSEHMLATLLSLCRKLPQYRDNQRQNLWKDLGKVRSIRGETVLVVGAGAIGSAFAVLCKAMGAHTVGLKRTVSGPVDGFDVVDEIGRLDEWLPQADVVALIVPHTPDTVNLMNADRIRCMKSDAILLSDGRGTVLDQDALAQAMTSGHLWGAALDVTSPEPLPADSPLWSIPNLLLTPHVAGGMRLDASRTSAVAFCLENIRRYAAGQPLRGVVRSAK